MTSSLNIQITHAASRWIAEHGGTLTLRTSPRHGCCGGTAAVPVAEAKIPPNPDAYTRIEIDGVQVYADPVLTGTQKPMTIDLTGFWRWHRLTIEDAEIRGNPTRNG
ncbi:MAG: CC/Se motif family (seleno)protein [Phycisphaeraceae bacterium]